MSRNFSKLIFEKYVGGDNMEDTIYPKRIKRISGKSVRNYNFIKDYGNYALYQERDLGFKECFDKHDCGILRGVDKKEWDSIHLNETIVNVKPERMY